MINIGKQYLTKPTAESQFDLSIELQEQFKNYDRYVYNLYNTLKDNWSLSAVKSFTGVPNTKGHTQGTPSQNEAIVEPFRPVKTGFRGLSPDLFTESSTFTPYKPTDNSFKYTKLKPHKAKKKGKSYRLTVTTCPSCLSTLKLTSSGVWQCSGDRLDTWKKEFLTYNALDDKDKAAFILNYEDPSIFLNLLEKFNFIDKNGCRSNFQCDYSNRLGSIVHSYSVSIPDPILVKTIERNLHRKLNELELDGQNEIYLYQGNYSNIWIKGCKKVKITRIDFPRDVL